MPGMKVLPEGGHEFCRVIRGWIGHAKGFAEDSNHEQVLFTLLFPFEHLTVRANVELVQAIPER
jgi:hypothetical protein